MRYIFCPGIQIDHRLRLSKVGWWQDHQVKFQYIVVKNVQHTLDIWKLIPWYAAFNLGQKTEVLFLIIVFVEPKWEKCDLVKASDPNDLGMTIQLEAFQYQSIYNRQFMSESEVIMYRLWSIWPTFTLCAWSTSVILYHTGLQYRFSLAYSQLHLLLGACIEISRPLTSVLLPSFVLCEDCLDNASLSVILEPGW